MGVGVAGERLSLVGMLTLVEGSKVSILVVALLLQEGAQLIIVDAHLVVATEEGLEVVGSAAAFTAVRVLSVLAVGTIPVLAVGAVPVLAVGAPMVLVVAGDGVRFPVRVVGLM